VIFFLVVTALINIALGYGLAVYFGHAGWPRASHAEEPAPEHVADHVHEEITIATPTPVATHVAASAPPTASAPLTASAEVAAALAAAPAPAAEPTAPEAELENEVLAGIEEFRSQLAQMKAQPSAGSTPAEAAAAAAVV
jgi:hypothetical protein